VPDLDPAVLGLAEDANTYTPVRPDDERIEDDRYVIYLARGGGHPAFTVVQRLRLADVEADLAEIRTLLRERGRLPCTWEVGTHATPVGVVDRLLDLGLEPYSEPLAIGMVLRTEPAGGPPTILARRVQTPEELAEATRIARIAFGHEDPDAVDLDQAVRDLQDEQREGTWASYVALAGDFPVAQAQATFTPHGVVMNGGSTLPQARGRGAYRALVWARWNDAVARGTPVLITQAGAMSRPVLERLGFEAVCEIAILLDDPDGEIASKP